MQKVTNCVRGRHLEITNDEIKRGKIDHSPVREYDKHAFQHLDLCARAHVCLVLHLCKEQECDECSRFSKYRTKQS